MDEHWVDIRRSCYAPEDGGIGDFSLVRSDDGWHLFHMYREFRKRDEHIPIQASRGINRKMGHAYSPDLLSWETKRPVLEIDPELSHESLMMFAPAVVSSEKTWHMLYTGVDSRSASLDRDRASAVKTPGGYTDRLQSICIATSQDIYNWNRPVKRPVINVRDNKWAQWSFAGNKDCRDPYVIPFEDGFLLYYTTYETAGPLDRENGMPVIAAAYSEDLYHWDDRGPVLRYRVWDRVNSLWAPMESVCVFERNDLYYMFWNMYEAGRFCVFWTESRDPLRFNGKINLFGDHFVAFKILPYGPAYSHFAAFTNEYYGVLRLYRLEWHDTIPRLYVGPPEYDG